MTFEQETIRELRRENDVLRAELKKACEVIDSISTLINLFRREGHAVANYSDDKGRLRLCEELETMFPFSK